MSEYADLGTGHEDANLDTGHESFGSEHDHLQHFQTFGEAHAHENDQHYAHAHHVEYDDGHGGHYEESDVTEFDGHEASADNTFAEQFTDQDHTQAEGELETLHEHFDSELSQYAHEGGAQALTDGGPQPLTDGGPQHLSAVSN
jgi:hypothetical protein